MRARRLLAAAMSSVLLSLGAALPAAADGIVVPSPPPCEGGDCPEPFPMRQLAIQNHDVEVSIERGVAVTRIDQTFRNDNDYPVEGTYIFPLPPEAALSDFRLWIGGEPVPGEVLTQEDARRRYEEIVRQLKDPALLEYMEGGAFQASVFPIDPGDTRRIRLTYSQVVSREADLMTYRYPLNTEKFSTLPLERVTLSVEAQVNGGVGAIYSPSHDGTIDRTPAGFHWTYEAHDVLPDRDFVLHYSLAERGLGVNLLSYRDPSSPDEAGTFLLLAAPEFDAHEQDPIAKDVILVLDQSGSMDGVKFNQAQEAARYVLQNLNESDRFGLLAFSSTVRLFQREMVGTGRVAEGLRWIDSLAAEGATDINWALLEALALADPERATYLLFLTDGLPTEGVTESERILENAAEAAPASVRLFAFGVGYDVDTYLLDSLTAEHSGTSSYVTPEEDIDEAIAGLYGKLDAPVLTDLELSVRGAAVHGLQPSQLPDLFAGSQLVVLGRYRNAGEVTITLQGQDPFGPVSLEYGPFELRAEGGPEYLPRIWATRKVGSLLREIRLEGANEELVEQVVSLSVRHGIVTPYTSYLVTEPGSLSREGRQDLVGEVLEEMAAPQAVSGQEAVERAAAEASIAEADDAGQLEGDSAELVRWIGDRTFRWTDGVWVDTAFDPAGDPPVQVQYLSETYFQLAGRSERLAAAFALGPRVLALAEGQAYEVVEVGGREAPESVPLPAGSETPAESPGGTEASSATTEEVILDPSMGRGRSPFCPGMVAPLGAVALLVTWRRRSRD